MAELIATAVLGSKRLAERCSLKPLSSQPLVAIDEFEESISRRLVEERRQRLAAAVDTAPELGVGLDERSRSDIYPPRSQCPRRVSIQQLVRVIETLHGRPAVVLN